ncbi:MAG: isopentenyl-diphosphate Delta-isomerase [Clostridiales bacterium]|nr:isopentenyl-diphosphate Delta-isomerase [Clostridiales bacterium]
MPEVILVDFQDRPLGTMEKMEAHRQQKLHRAFSVFLCRGDQVLLQKRASHKYHCGGLWTNTCCSHPQPGETVPEAARRRLAEELGITQSPALEEVDVFFYRCPFPNGLTEFECDHVLLGEYNGAYTPDPSEVEDMAWVSVSQLEADLLEHPEAYTPWFLICAPKVFAALRRRAEP